MFRLATAFATALFLALHAAPLADAVVVANTCTPSLATFVDDAAFFSAGEGNFGSTNDKPGLVFAELQSRQRGNGASVSAKSKLHVGAASNSPGNPADSTATSSSPPTNTANFTVVYTPYLAGAPNTGRVTLTVRYLGWSSSETVTSNVNTGLTQTASVIGIFYKGARQGNSNRITTTLSGLRVNQMPYTPVSPLIASNTSDGQKHYIYINCTTPGSITLEGTISFVWSATTGNLLDRGSLMVAFGKPAGCCHNQRTVLTPVNGVMRASCGCWGELWQNLAGHCVCYDTRQLQTEEGQCQDPVPSIRRCLTMPFFENQITENSMLSQTDVKSNNQQLPAKAYFTETGYGASGLRVSAKAFSDGLKSAQFTWIGNGLRTAAQLAACTAKYTQSLSATTIMPDWDTFDKLMGNETLQQGVDTEMEDIDDWKDLSKVHIDLRLPAEELIECGFEPITDPNDAYYSDESVSYRNTLCGEFKYSECYSDAWGWVTVPTDVKTCYLVMVDIPRNISKEAHVTMVDVQKVDMRFSSRTDCAAGPVNGLWKTELEFKTIVQYPYTVTQVLVTSLDNNQTVNASTTSPNPLCDRFSEYTNFTLVEAVFDNLDPGDLMDNSYCAQNWTLAKTLAAVQGAHGNCGPNDVDQFKVTIKGMCQPTILNTPENQHIACPTTDNTFSYETIVSVPRVCMRTFGFDKEDFPATLMLYETLEPLKEAAVYTPNSQMCGKLTITPQADNQIDEEWLEDYVLDKLEVYYTSTNSLAIDTINIPIEISSAGLISKSQAVIDVPTGDAWVASFCFKVDSKHVPGLLHSFNEVTNTDHPDVSTTSNGISIFMRHYTVRATAKMVPNSSNRRLRTRVDRFVAEASTGGKSRAEAGFELLQYAPAAPVTKVSSEGGPAAVKAAAPESSKVQAESEQSGLPEGAKVGIGVGVGIAALVALVIGSVVIMRRRAAV